jgi:hypothetical protein
MAFGKDTRTLSAVGSFRQVSNTMTKHAKFKKKDRGGIPYFVDMYTPSSDDIDTIRLVPGAYLQDQIQGDEEAGDIEVVQVIAPFIKFVDHFDGTRQKGAICSAGPFANDKKRRLPCHGCDIFWDTCVRSPTGRLESTRMGRQNKYAFSVYDYGTYHKMPQIDRETGTPRMNPTTKQPYFNWVKCLGQGCDACKARLESKPGNMSHWPISYTQLQVLRNAETNIGKSCTTCGTDGSIVSLGWECPECGDCAIDMATSELKKDELLQLTDNAHICASCHAKVYLREVYECRTCAPRGQTGARATLFDVDLRVQVIKGANNSNVLQVMGWSTPHPIPDALTEVTKPIDLVARYAPASLEVQAEKFGVTVAKREPVTSTSAPAEGAPAARTYANPYGTKTA